MLFVVCRVCEVFHMWWASYSQRHEQGIVVLAKTRFSADGLIQTKNLVNTISAQLKTSEASHHDQYQENKTIGHI